MPYIRRSRPPVGLGCQYSGALRRVIEHLQRRLHSQATIIQRRVRVHLRRCRIYRQFTVCVDGEIYWRNIPAERNYWAVQLQRIARGFLARRRLYHSTQVHCDIMRDLLREYASLL